MKDLLDRFLVNDALLDLWWQILPISIFMFLCNSIFFLVIWYIRRGAVIEYGYPKRSTKAMNKKMKAYSKLDEILLLRVTFEADRIGFYSFFNLLLHYINVFGYIASIVGIAAAMITLGDGWALTLMFGGMLFVLAITTMLDFVPSLIWLPSERKRYGLNKKRNKGQKR